MPTLINSSFCNLSAQHFLDLRNSMGAEAISKEGNPMIMLFPNYVPSCWGPVWWNMLHTMAVFYHPDEESKKALVSFMEALPYLLPCADCGKGLKEIMEKRKDQFLKAIESNGECNRFFFDIHNDVNQKLGRPLAAPEILEEYKQRTMIHKDAKVGPVMLQTPKTSK